MPCVCISTPKANTKEALWDVTTCHDQAFLHLPHKIYNAYRKKGKFCHVKAISNRTEAQQW